MNTFRYIEEQGELSSAYGLAGDEALALSVSEGLAPPTLRLYKYRPSVIVGRYQNLSDAVDLEACKRHGYEWNRRYTGGGTVVMGPEQLAIALVLPEKSGRFAGSIRRHFQFFAGVLSDALMTFNVKADFLGKNDLCIDGRKTAGLAISQDIDGVVFFHCSLLLDFDISLMVEVLNLPTQNLEDRGQSCFSQRMTTVREHAPDVTFDGMKKALLHALENKLDKKAEPGEWTDTENENIACLKNERYENDDWIYSSRVMRRWKGSCERKTPGGTLKAYIDGNGGVLDAVLITGDYFSRNVDLAVLETNLKGTPARRDRVLAVIQKCACNKIYRVAPETLTDIILTAANK